MICHNVYTEVRDASGVLRLQTQQPPTQSRPAPQSTHFVTLGPSNGPGNSTSALTTSPSTAQPVIGPIQNPPSPSLPIVTAQLGGLPAQTSIPSSSAIVATMTALEKSLLTISQELHIVSSATAYVNVARITELANGAGAVADALERMRRLAH